MRAWIIGAALAALVGQACAQQTAAPAPKPPVVVTSPDWRSKPTGQDLARVYPDRAQRENRSGSATMSCGVTAEGKLANCTVVSEEPEGYGFGAAAVALAPTFRMAKTLDGQSVEGGTVRIPIIFRVFDNAGRAKATLLTNPPWRSVPNPASVSAAYPKQATELDGGSAVVRCGFEFDGRTRNCAIISQTPSGKGFGAAAVSLAKEFVVRPAGLPALPLILAEIPFAFRNPARPQPTPALQPHWVVALSSAGAQQVFPAAARAAGVTNGLGVVTCAVGAGGEMVECQAQREEPAGLGFGAAGIEAAKLMVMNPWSEEGNSLVGRRLTLPIRLRLEAAAAPVAVP